MIRSWFFIICLSIVAATSGAEPVVALGDTSTTPTPTTIVTAVPTTTSIPTTVVTATPTSEPVVTVLPTTALPPTTYPITTTVPSPTVIAPPPTTIVPPTPTPTCIPSTPIFIPTRFVQETITVELGQPFKPAYRPFVTSGSCIHYVWTSLETDPDFFGASSFDPYDELVPLKVGATWVSLASADSLRVIVVDSSTPIPTTVPVASPTATPMATSTPTATVMPSIVYTTVYTTPSCTPSYNFIPRDFTKDSFVAELEVPFALTYEPFTYSSQLCVENIHTTLRTDTDFFQSSSYRYNDEIRPLKIGITSIQLFRDRYNSASDEADIIIVPSAQALPHYLEEMATFINSSTEQSERDFNGDGVVDAADIMNMKQLSSELGR